MTRKPRRRAATKSKKPPVRRNKNIKPKSPRHDPLDSFITAAALALDLPTEKSWLPAIKANLRITLQLAATVTAFDLPESAEPA
ncbi:MAG: DUF4089 domain-containing protein, partial [Xanthobacteraceae bacterium]